MPNPIKKAFKKVGKKAKKLKDKLKGKVRRRGRRNNGLGPAPENHAPPQVEEQNEVVPQPTGPRIGGHRGNRNAWRPGQKPGVRGETKLGTNRVKKTAPKQPLDERIDEKKPHEDVPETDAPKQMSDVEPKKISGSDAPIENDKPEVAPKKVVTPYELWVDPEESNSDESSPAEKNNYQVSDGSEKSGSDPTPSGDDSNVEVEAKKTSGGGEDNYKRIGDQEVKFDIKKNDISDSTGSDATPTSSVSDSTETKEVKRRTAELQKKQLETKRNEAIKAAVHALQREKKEELQDKQSGKKKGAKKKKPDIVLNYKNNYQDNSGKEAPKTDNYGTDNYQSNNSGTDNYKTEQGSEQKDESVSSSSNDDSISMITDEIELTPDELATIQAKVERDLGIAIPEVQELFAGMETPEPIALMQRKLRDHSSGNLVDPDEKGPGGESIKVNRGKKSANESNSKGWATIAMRDTYQKNDSLKGDGGSFNTKYMFDETTKLEGIYQSLGSQQDNNRKDFVIRLVDGKWKDAKDGLVDTGGEHQSNQAFNERLRLMQDRLEEARQSERSEGFTNKDSERHLALKERVRKLALKTDKKEIAKHISVTGKYIYAMNAAGQFFAAQGINMILHHSSFLAGGAVACAGEIGVAGGVTNYISNQSGHYRPGPAYLWQAVQQLKLSGCPLGGVRVNVMGVPFPFRSGDEFLAAMNPAEDPKLFDGHYAVTHLTEKAQALKTKRHEDKQNQPSQQETEIKV